MVLSPANNMVCFVQDFCTAGFMQAVLGGILRGCGKQLPVAIINMASYYLLGLPVALALVYAANLGALGFWIGSFAGCVIQVGYLYAVSSKCSSNLSSKLPLWLVGFNT